MHFSCGELIVYMITIYKLHNTRDGKVKTIFNRLTGRKLSY